MICFHDPSWIANHLFQWMAIRLGGDGHQVAMANHFQPLKLEHSQPEVGAKKPTRQNLFEPPPEKWNQRGIAWNLKRSPPQLERKII